MQFWLTLTSAMVLFLIALGTVQAYKSGLVENFRAQLLRKRLKPVIDHLVGNLINVSRGDLARSDLDSYIGSELDYSLRRKRAELEHLFSRASVLYPQERDSIDSILAQVSKLSSQFENNAIDPHLLESTILLGQRTAMDLAEIAK